MQGLREELYEPSGVRKNSLWDCITPRQRIIFWCVGDEVQNVALQLEKTIRGKSR